MGRSQKQTEQKSTGKLSKWCPLLLGGLLLLNGCSYFANQPDGKVFDWPTDGPHAVGTGLGVLTLAQWLKQDDEKGITPD